MIEVPTPLSNPLHIITVATAIFLVGPWLFRRLRLPGIIGIIVLGAAIGPNSPLGLLERGEAVVLLGTVGLLYLMFMAGVELDLVGFKKHKQKSLWFGVLTFTIPQVLGTALFLALGFEPLAAILIASMFASHTLVAYPVVTGLGLAKNPAVTMTVGGTILTDTAALVLLGIVAAAYVGDLNATFWGLLAVKLVIFVGVIAIVLPRVGRLFFRLNQPGNVTEFVFVLFCLLACSAFATVLSIEPILGAFMAGLFLNRSIPELSVLNDRIHFFGNAFFIPFFLFSIGMLVDPAVLTSGLGAWGIMIAMLLCNVITKWIASTVACKIFDFSRPEKWIVFGLSTTEAAATLAATLVGYELGLLDDTVLNGVILMIAVTCIMGPFVVQVAGRYVVRHRVRDDLEGPSRRPHRVLVPVANPEQAPRLLGLATAIRGVNGSEPIFPLTVVVGTEDDSQDKVREAERTLQEARKTLEPRGIPIHPMTRIDQNPIRGILRAAADNRISEIVVGWDGSGPEGWIFGTVLDRLFNKSIQEVLVARLSRPLEQMERVFLILPQDIEFDDGYPHLVDTIGRLSNALRLPVVLATIGAESGAYEADLESRDVVVTQRAEFDNWPVALRELPLLVESTDLIVVATPREGTVAWNSVYRGLSRALAAEFDNDLVMIKPSRLDRAYGSRAAGMGER